MSDYVVHFTKPQGHSSAYDGIMGILSQQVIRAYNPFGIARQTAPNIDSQRVACFSETPLHYLSRIVDRRSQYGIVFRKNFVVSRGGNPILYAYKDQPVADAIRALMAQGRNTPDAHIWTITPFVDVVGGTYNFEWEREWRHVGDFSFTPADVAFLIIPQDSHQAARQFFEDAGAENVGPNYNCPFIDGRWNEAQIANHLSGPW
ncbi:abortive infection system antitoxin AbiGi family protein [Brevundimonas sp. NIBR11]|uniref:abortive infection system antitoxin AbiGi family protein n=1 Tax=Brevundimonas sp. NIBR11 TaxID=3015999 RepID=UPI0022F0EF5D|nr:abortive infection system antitoxin AbiGi family protein [Brevundimonas sp. NIBR11]WGM32571.1 hypothetical protein KKHFBJBL_02825 [Brevundimonas sp. NIBR11]